MCRLSRRGQQEPDMHGRAPLWRCCCCCHDFSASAQLLPHLPTIIQHARPSLETPFKHLTDHRSTAHSIPTTVSRSCARQIATSLHSHTLFSCHRPAAFWTGQLLISYCCLDEDITARQYNHQNGQINYIYAGLPCGPGPVCLSSRGIRSWQHCLHLED